MKNVKIRKKLGQKKIMRIQNKVDIKEQKEALIQVDDTCFAQAEILED